MKCLLKEGRLARLCVVVLLALILFAGTGTAEESDLGFQLVAGSFSSGGTSATDGDVTLTACCIGGLGVEVIADSLFSIEIGDLLPIIDAGPLFLESSIHDHEWRFSWDAAGCVLEQSDSLGDSAAWTPVLGGDGGYVVLPLDASQRFFRLRCDFSP